ncbi:MAG: hypothetical protein ABI430_04290 [Candidatus Taylorbacteria bacterium]
MNTPPSTELAVWLEEVMSGKCDSPNAPITVVEDNETVIGTLQSPKARAFYSRRQDVIAQIGSLTKEGKPTTKKGKEQFANAIVPLKSEFEILSRLFWLYLQHEFPQSRLPMVEAAIRKDWSVVTCKSKGPDISQIVRDFFG